MCTFVQYRLAQPRFVVKAERGHNCPVRIHRADQSFALKRHPNGRVAQPTGVFGCHHGIAEMEMIAVRIRRLYGNA